MTTTTKTILGSLAACLAFGALAADPAISDVTVRQRWPWSRLVDIDYVLTCDDTQQVDIALNAYNGPTALTLPSASLSGNLYNVTEGPRRIVWDPTVTAYTNNQMLTQFNVTLAATPSPLYMVIDLSGGTSATSYLVTNYVAAADVPGGVTSDVYKTTSLLLRRIPANAFTMGESPSTLPVTLTKAFYAGVYEVTQKQWQQVMGDVRFWPSYWSNSTYRDTRPVEGVSYYDIRENPVNGDDPAVDWPSNNAVTANSFMGRICAKTGIGGFDLPTEAQWECLCRAGTATYYNDNLGTPGNMTTNAQMDALGRYLYNGGKCWNGAYVDPGQSTTTTGATATVGAYLPNAWGLYDTHGNVWEWCRDWYTNSLGTAAATDPAGAMSSSGRVIRGGCWNGDASSCRSAARDVFPTGGRIKSIGFRLVRTLP